MNKINYPKKPGRMVVVRDCTVAICNNNNPASILLSTFLFWHDNPWKLDTYQETEGTFTMCRTQAEIEEQACNQIDVKTIHDTAVPFLQLFGYLTVKEKMNGNMYILHIDRVLAAYAAFEQKAPALKNFLKASLQLESAPIKIVPDELELVLINKNPLYLQLERVLIANRLGSNCKRGRKPKSKAALEGISEETETIRESNEIDNNEKEYIGESLRGEIIVDGLASVNAHSSSQETSVRLLYALPTLTPIPYEQGIALLTHSSSIQSMSIDELHIAVMDTSLTDAFTPPEYSNVTTRNGDNHADLPAWSADGDSAFCAPGMGDHHPGNGDTGQLVQVGQKEEIDGQLDEEATIHRMPAIKPQGDNHELSVHRSDYRGPHDDDLHHCHADTERSLALSSDEALRASGTANIAARVASETGNEGVEYHASNHHSSQPHRGDSSGMGATHSPGLAQSTVALQAGNGGDTAPTGRDVALEESTPEAPHEQDDSAQASPPSAVVNPGHNPLHRSDDVPRVPPTGYQPSSNMFSTENVDKPVDHNRVDKPPAPDKQAENATPTGKGTRKPRQTKPKVDDARIKAVFACMDATIRELTGDKTFTYTQPKTDQKIIADFIGEHEVSPIHLRENMIEMWNTPKDEKSGFEWKNNMSVRAIFNNYDRFRIMLNGKKNGHKPPATARPPSHVSVPQNDEPLVVWRPPTKTAQYHSMAARGR